MKHRRTRSMFNRAAPAALLLVALAHFATPARATVEEFASFSVRTQERDDESLLDHLLTRLPRAWDAEWARAPGGFRTSQGCLTSGEWFIDTEFKARAPMGARAWFGVDLLQSESDILSVQNLDLSFHFPLRFGAATAMFRPSPEKASQDFAIGWETGADTSAIQFRATWTVEDIFNNFWAFRQTQVGGLGEPYEKRPYEPALYFAVRQPRWRAEAGGKWLTASRKRIVDLSTAQALLHRDLWGATGHALVAATAGGLTFEARGDQRQARGRDEPIALSSAAAIDYRRQWSAEGSVRGVARGRTAIEARTLYQSRQERLGPPAAPAYLDVEDRLLHLDVIHEFHPRFSARAGGIYERLGVATARWTDFNFGTRTESRAYFGVIARFGRVRVSGIEGIELDPESYEVWAVHDKGFLQLQTEF